MVQRTVRYTPEFKRQMVDLVRSGRSPASLAKEFGPTAWSISLWVKQDARDSPRAFYRQKLSTGPKPTLRSVQQVTYASCP